MINYILRELDSTQECFIWSVKSESVWRSELSFTKLNWIIQGFNLTQNSGNKMAKRKDMDNLPEHKLICVLMLERPEVYTEYVWLIWTLYLAADLWGLNDSLIFSGTSHQSVCDKSLDWLPKRGFKQGDEKHPDHKSSEATLKSGRQQVQNHPGMKL